MRDTSEKVLFAAAEIVRDPNMSPIDKDKIMPRKRRASLYCRHPGCTTHANFGVESSKKVEFCGRHADRSSMINLRMRRCHHKGCTTFPYFGVEGTKRVEFCAEHAKDGMVDVGRRKCAHPQCEKYPSYGVRKGKKAEYCAPHAPKDMVPVNAASRKICGHQGCAFQANFGIDGTKKGEFCSRHAPDGMVNVLSKRCGHPGCPKYPSFGVEGIHRTGEFCAAHKKEGMVIVSGKRCSDPECSKRATHGMEGPKKPESCAQHAKVGMVMIQRSWECCHHAGCTRKARSKFCYEHAPGGTVAGKSTRKPQRCLHRGCSTQASCGIEGSGIAERCALHASTGMVIIQPKTARHRNPSKKVNTQRAKEQIKRAKERCHEPDCDKRASYGVRIGGITKGEFCPEHAKDGMVSIYNNLCSHDGCGTSANYGPPGTKAKYCARHAAYGMINLSSRKCAAPDCIKYPSYGSEGSKRATYCAKHAEDGMIAIRRSTFGNGSGNSNGAPTGVVPYATDGGIKPEEEERRSRPITPHNPDIYPAAALGQPFLGFSRKRGRVDS